MNTNLNLMTIDEFEFTLCLHQKLDGFVHNTPAEKFCKGKQLYKDYLDSPESGIKNATDWSKYSAFVDRLNSPSHLLDQLLSAYNFYYEFSDDYEVYQLGLAMTKEIQELARNVEPDVFNRLWDKYAPEFMKSIKEV
jgi:hypothetical protein